MADYTAIKNLITDVVKTNGAQEITGANLQNVLVSMINAVASSNNDDFDRINGDILNLLNFVDTENEDIRNEMQELANRLDTNRYGYNVTVFGLVAGVHTLATAVKNVPPAERFGGQKITFKTDAGWVTYQNTSLSIDNYEDVNNWVLDSGVNVEGNVTITNNPDYEDLTQNSQNELKFADKEYSAATFSGLGRIYLRKNIVSNKNVLTQAMLADENTIYIIQYDYDLNDASITVPANCVLKFDGGSFSNGTIVGIKTKVVADNIKIFNNVSFEGAFCNSWNVCWFGAVGDCHIVDGYIQNATDNTSAIQAAFDSITNLDGVDVNSGWSKSFQALYFPTGKYAVYGQINVPRKTAMYGDDSNSTAIVCEYNGTVFYYHPSVGTTPTYWTLDVHDLSFEVSEYSDKTVCAFANLRTADTSMRTYTSRWRFSRCKFMRFNIALNIEVAYYGRVTDCDFSSNKTGDVRLTNPNSTSFVNCNFMSGRPPKEYCILFTASNDGKDGVIGSNVSGCNFDEGGIPIVVDTFVNGLNISGNYFEPYNTFYNSENERLETDVRPIVHLANNERADVASVTDFVFQGNGNYYKYANWSIRALEPVRYILIDSTRILNSYIDTEVCINPDTAGFGNIGQINAHPYTSLVDNYTQTRTLELLIYNTEQGTAQYDSYFNQLKTLRNSAMALMNSVDADADNKAAELFSLYVTKASGIAHIKTVEPEEVYLATGATFDATTEKYSLNGITNLTKEQMREVVKWSLGWQFPINAKNLFIRKNMRTIAPPSNGYGESAYPIYFVSAERMFRECYNLKVVNFDAMIVAAKTKALVLSDYESCSMKEMFSYCSALESINSIISLTNIPDITDMFVGCTALKTVFIKVLASNISFADSPNLTKESLVYMINNAAGGRSIIITLNSSAYNRLNGDSDVITALSAKPLISLASA